MVAPMGSVPWVTQGGWLQPSPPALRMLIGTLRLMNGVCEGPLEQFHALSSVGIGVGVVGGWWLWKTHTWRGVESFVGRHHPMPSRDPKGGVYTATHTYMRLPRVFSRNHSTALPCGGIERSIVRASS